MLNIEIKKLPKQINYSDKIMLIGSCFTEHIGNSLEELKFSLLQNPNGILFDPVSVCKSLESYIENKNYTEENFFQLNDAWHSWQHHSRFSNTNLKEAIRLINESQQTAHEFLKKTDWLIITLGSSFSYRLTELALKTAGVFQNIQDDFGVANCHRAPAQWFNKYLLSVDEIISVLQNCILHLFDYNPKLNIIFTVSPVRHIREGVIDNNRSKSRLIESVHHLVNKFERVHYFPAYELVIDVLRDYRFYDSDLVHPNYMATEFVLGKFAETCVEIETRQIMDEIKKIVIARKHKALHPETNAHRQFLSSHFEKAKSLQEKHPFLNLQKEIDYFSGNKTL